MSTVSTTTLEDKASGDNTQILNAIHGSAKVWAYVTNSGTPTIVADYGVDSLTDVGTGQVDINLTNPFASSPYSAVVTAGGSSAENATAYGHSVGSFRVNTKNNANNNADLTFCCVAFGDQ